MDGCDNVTYCNNDRENYIFVKLLSKYKVIFETSNTPEMRRKKNEAAHAIADELNQKCGKELTAKQLVKKVHDLKQRLKVNHYKKVSERYHRPYQTWERMFLNVWTGHGISVNKKKTQRKPPGRKNLQAEPKDIVMKFEAGYNLLDDGQSCSSKTSSESEPEGDEKEKRACLISQIRTLKAQEVAERAKEKICLSKLSFLQQNNIEKSATIDGSSI